MAFRSLVACLGIGCITGCRRDSRQPTVTAFRSHHDCNDSAVTANRSPTPYPPAFLIQFDTNVTRQDEEIARSNNNNNTNESLRSTLYYDWNLRAQRIDHAPGSYECVRFYNVSSSCQLYFLPEGMYRIISRENGTRNSAHHLSSREKENSVDCCLDIPGLGAPPPDWARRANPTFNGLVHDSYSGLDAYEFVFDRGQVTSFITPHSEAAPTTTRLSNGQHDDGQSIYDQFHTTREVRDGIGNSGAPLLFTFPSKAMGRQDFHFDPASLLIGNQDPEIFRLPEGCETIRCGSDQQKRHPIPEILGSQVDVI